MVWWGIVTHQIAHIFFAERLSYCGSLFSTDIFCYHTLANWQTTNEIYRIGTT